MTRYSDNIYSGFDAAVSADASRSGVILRKSYFVSAGSAVNVIVSGTFPPNTQNVAASLYVVQAGAATTNDNIILYTNGNASTGTKILSFLAVGSAATFSTAPTVITSAAYQLIPPATNASNGGEIPFQIIVSSVSTASYKIVLSFDRGDTGGMAGTTS